MKARVNKVTIALVQGELLDMDTEAIVHETDADLHLSPALIARAGPDVRRETAAIGRCDVGSAVVTSGGSLKARLLFHAVGPRWGEGSERGKLASATFECLRLAESLRVRSIAFPPISIGVNGYPIENCALTMLSQIINFTFEDLRSLKRVFVVLDDKRSYEVFRLELMAQLDSLSQDGVAPAQG